MTKTHLITFMAFLLAVQAGSAFGQVQYAITDLGTLGAVAGINDSGQVVGFYYTGIGGSYHAYLFSGSGPMQDIGTLGGPSSNATCININGQIVGTADTTAGYGHAFLYSGNGPMQDLGTLGGPYYSQACGINDFGQIVGNAGTKAGYNHAFLYSGSGPMKDLGTLGGPASLAEFINNNGQIVGNANTQAGNYNISHAFLYNGSGPMQDLGTLGGESSEARCA